MPTMLCLDDRAAREASERVLGVCSSGHPCEIAIGRIRVIGTWSMDGSVGGWSQIWLGSYEKMSLYPLCQACEQFHCASPFQRTEHGLSRFLLSLKDSSSQHVPQGVPEYRVE